MSSSPAESFRADAAVVWRLGAELFTSTDQALVELIKNSYDAGAERVELRITRPTTQSAPPAPAPELPGEDGGEISPVSATVGGSILIIDDGSGMSAEEIVRGWLTLSASLKAEQKQAGIAPDKRVPLGDKGLGRLGAQRLGRRLRLRTRPAAVKGSAPLEHDVTIDWGEFQSGRLLSDITPEWITHEDLAAADPWPGAITGTVLEITEPYAQDSAWADESTLQRSLSTVMNPYASVQSFEVTVTLDGTPVDVQQVAEQVRTAALTRWLIEYTDGKLRVRGTIRREWFRPKEQDRRALLQRELRSSEGRSEMITRLGARGPIADVTFDVSEDHGFTAEHTVDPDQIAPFPPGDPGPFRMELDMVSLELAVAKELSLSVFDRQADYRRWVRERGGVSIFRDGFIVAAGDDLLQLGKEFTSGGSFYGLRPQNVLGYIAISARENAQLQETTSREDFRRNDAFIRFQALLRLAVRQINRVLDEAGRAGSEWARELSERSHGLFGLTGDELVGQASELAERSKTAAASIQRAASVLSALDVAEDETDRQRAELLRELEVAERTLHGASELAPLVDHLRGQLEEAELNYEDLLATAGLGLAAEGLAHDITQVMERLQLRARAAASTRAKAPVEVELLLDEVDWAAGALRAQLRHLDPMLRYTRLRRTEVSLGKLVKDTAAFHRDRLHPQGVTVTVSVQRPARVRLSPGRLGQVLDNLVHNSVFWLSETPREDGELASIHFTVNGGEITVSDSGPGVPEDLGSQAFEPFVTRKHEGRGLGLWLARQLLDLDGASIELEHNPDGGRLSLFRIVFPAANEAAGE